MPNPYKIYKIGQNIFLRWGPRTAEAFRRLSGNHNPENLRKLNLISQGTGFSPKVMNKMASERLLITGKRTNLSPIEQAIKNEYVNKDWSSFMLPKGARGIEYGKKGHPQLKIGEARYKSQVPKAYELDSIKNSYLKSGTVAQKKATRKRFYDEYLHGTKSKYDGSGRIRANLKPKKSKFPG